MKKPKPRGLPAKISTEDRLQLLLHLERVSRIEGTLAYAKESMQAHNAMLASKYRVADGDGIDKETGVITRKASG